MRAVVFVELRLLFERVHAIINIVEQLRPDLDPPTFAVRHLGNPERKVIAQDRVVELDELANSRHGRHGDDFGKVSPPRLGRDPNAEFDIDHLSENQTKNETKDQSLKRFSQTANRLFLMLRREQTKTDINKCYDFGTSLIEAKLDSIRQPALSKITRPAI